MQPEVPFHRPSIGREEIDEVVRTLESGWLTTGPRTFEFERAFREYVGVPYALGVNSCTAGLQLALAALQVGPGDEVITTPLTFCATVNVILHQGATPILADVGPDGNIDPDSVQEKVTERTRAILPVHLAGLPVEMDRIWEIARRNRLYVIEDCAHAIGSMYHGWPVGAGNPDAGYFSDASAYSFYATKNITTGEGGMVISHDERIMDRLRILCLHGISKDAWNRYTNKGTWHYEVLEPGFKSNLSDLQSAIGIHQLRKLENFVEVRKRYAQIYHELLSDIEELELPPDRADSRHSWHLYMLRLNLDRLELDRGEFIEELRRQGIGTSVHFIPIPLHPFFAAAAELKQNSCPAALALYPRLVSLPLYPAMTESQVEQVAGAVKTIAQSARRKKVAAAVMDGR